MGGVPPLLYLITGKLVWHRRSSGQGYVPEDDGLDVPKVRFNAEHESKSNTLPVLQNEGIVSLTLLCTCEYKPKICSLIEAKKMLTL